MKVCVFERFLKISFVFVAMVLLASVAVFDGRNVSALTYSSSHDIQFTFNSVISINLSSPNLVISDLAPGEYSDSNIITVGATTNGSAGFQLSATVGQKNGTDALVNTTSSSNTFANLTSTKATLANFSDNTWGYSYCADSSTNCGTSGSGTWVSGSKGSTTAGYAGLPLDNNDNATDRGKGGVLLLNTSGPEDTIQSVQFKIGAKASSGQASGDYTNTINFYAVANPEPQLGPVACEARKICYNENALTPVEGTMGKQPAGGYATVTLLASNFSRSGYGFAGWNTAYDYSGTNYGPNETITNSDDITTNGLSLYAIWVKSTGSIQNWSGCTSLPQGSVTALTDQRDNETYAVAKLADGNCWMIENLRLEADNTRAVEKQALAQGYGSSTTYGDFTGLANAESDNFTNTNPPLANSLYSTDGSTTNTIKGGDSSVYYSRMPRYNNVNTQSRASSPTGYAVAMYSYGNYYTWAAAMASVIEYTSDTAQVDGKTSETANTSLCPTGWRLPYGRSTGNGAATGGFYNLNYKINDDNNAIGSTASLKLRSFPNNFLYSGYFATSSAEGRGSRGIYWSSTVDRFNNGYYMYLDSGNANPGTYSRTKINGLSIRCTVGS